MKIISNSKLSAILYDAFGYDCNLSFIERKNFYVNKLKELNLDKYIQLEIIEKYDLNHIKFIFRPNLYLDEYELVMGILRLYNIYKDES